MGHSCVAAAQPQLLYRPLVSSLQYKVLLKGSCCCCVSIAQPVADGGYEAIQVVYMVISMVHTSHSIIPTLCLLVQQVALISKVVPVVRGIDGWLQVQAKVGLQRLSASAGRSQSSRRMRADPAAHVRASLAGLPPQASSQSWTGGLPHCAADMTLTSDVAAAVAVPRGCSNSPIVHHVRWMFWTTGVKLS